MNGRPQAGAPRADAPGNLRIEKNAHDGHPSRAGGARFGAAPRLRRSPPAQEHRWPLLGRSSGLVADLAGRDHQPFWAAIPEGGESAAGWLSLCDVHPADAAVESGSIWFSPGLQRTRAASEAIFLLMREAFDARGYERLVWRHLARNTSSAAAAARYGFAFEGVWRRAATFKGARHDVVWRSILASQWPALRRAFESWLDPSNFDAAGRQRAALAAFTPRAPE